MAALSVQDRGTEQNDGGPSSTSRPVRVVYVVGAARSGSTILNAVLGMHPDIVATGELRYLATLQEGAPRRCACGALVTDCLFWQRVYSLWTAQVGAEAVAEWTERQAVYERMRGLPLLAGDAVLRPSRWRSHRMSTHALIDSVRQAAGAKVVADSSKSPMRAYLLLRTDGLEMRFLHLVRDPRGVVWSRLKARGRQRDARQPGIRVFWLVVHSTLDWILVNLLAGGVLFRAGDGRRVCYEDLANRPRETLTAIETLVGLDLSASAQAIAEGKPIDYQHIVGGNPRRLTGAAPIVFDRDWSMSSPAWVQRLVWRLAAPLARHYGYRR